MNRSLLPLAALALLVGACSSTQSAQRQNVRPLPARASGTAETRWGTLPTYTGNHGNPLVLDPARIPVSPSTFKVQADLLVERDGTVRDVFLLSSSGFPEVDAAVTAEFKEARSRLVLASTDPAPYVIRYTLARQVAVADSSSKIPIFSHNDYRFVNDRRMGTGQPIAGDDPRRP